MQFLSITSLLAFMAVTLPALASPVAAPAGGLESRAVIGHNQVQAFPQGLEPTRTGITFLNRKPFLFVASGCVPFPAVQANGDVSGGLQDTGPPSSGCSSSGGQVYVRGRWVGSKYGIMYAWYMPKDAPTTIGGHRHDWESIVVWVDNPANINPQVLSVATSGHGSYTKHAPSAVTFDGGFRPLIRYYNQNLVQNHEVDITRTKGGEQPLIQWERLTQAARNTLNSHNFGSANCPFKDSTFASNLAKAA